MIRTNAGTNVVVRLPDVVNISVSFSNFWRGTAYSRTHQNAHSDAKRLNLERKFVYLEHEFRTPLVPGPGPPTAATGTQPAAAFQAQQPFSGATYATLPDFIPVFLSCILPPLYFTPSTYCLCTPSVHSIKSEAGVRAPHSRRLGFFFKYLNPLCFDILNQ